MKKPKPDVGPEFVVGGIYVDTHPRGRGVFFVLSVDRDTKYNGHYHVRALFCTSDIFASGDVCKFAFTEGSAFHTDCVRIV